MLTVNNLAITNGYLPYTTHTHGFGQPLDNLRQCLPSKYGVYSLTGKLVVNPEGWFFQLVLVQNTGVTCPAKSNSDDYLTQFIIHD